MSQKIADLIDGIHKFPGDLRRVLDGPTADEKLLDAGHARALEDQLQVRGVLRLRLRGVRSTHHSFRGSFSAGSTPILASKYAFCSIFQDLRENHLLASKFERFLQNFAKFQIFSEFRKLVENILENFRTVATFYKNLQNLQKFLQNFAKFCRF